MRALAAEADPGEPIGLELRSRSRPPPSRANTTVSEKTTTTTTTTTNTSRRSASPVKRLALLSDLEDDGVFYQTLSETGAEMGARGSELLWALRDISDGEKTIPAVLRDELLPEMGRIKSSQLDSANQKKRV